MKKFPVDKLLALLTVACFLLTSCSKNDSDSSYDLAGDWKVVYFLDNGNKITKTEDNTWLDLNNGDITASFSEPNDKGAGTVSGITVTNGYNGEYTLEDNCKITISPVSTTFINEPEWTELYKISAAERFEIRNSELLIYYNNGNTVIAFERN
ncbi:MAG: hypothetical protein AAGF77_01960 [Bacteroidota bacterium]